MAATRFARLSPRSRSPLAQWRRPASPGFRRARDRRWLNGGDPLRPAFAALAIAAGKGLSACVGAKV
jgi:hypothetical protein